MTNPSYVRLQITVFTLVSAAFTNIYITIFGPASPFDSCSAVIGKLLSACAGFFAVHAAAVDSLNRKLASGQGRANALYMLFFHVGGWMGITCTGFAFKHGGWNAVLLHAVLHPAAKPPQVAGTVTPRFDRFR